MLSALCEMYASMLTSSCSYCCREFANKYAEDPDAFAEDYAASHKKLSELGVQWGSEGPITIDD